MGYSVDRTIACERTLISLLSGFGSLKDSLRLVGGLVPRYLTPEQPPHVPAHAGTMDVDIVLNIQLLAAGEAYKELAEQLKDRGFSRAMNAAGTPISWRWQRKVDDREFVVVDFLRDEDDAMPAGKVFAVDGEKISALSVKHAGIVHEWYAERDVTAELLDGGGKATERVRFADRVSFIVLKAIAFDQRHENKDAGDLLHVLRYAGDLEETVGHFRERIAAGKHVAAIDDALTALERRFCGNSEVEGYLRDGPVACGRFLFGTESGAVDDRALEQRLSSGLVTEFIRRVRE